MKKESKGKISFANQGQRPPGGQVAETGTIGVHPPPGTTNTDDVTATESTKLIPNTSTGQRSAHYHGIPHSKNKHPGFANQGGAAMSWVPFPGPMLGSSFDVRPRIPEKEAMEGQKKIVKNLVEGYGMSVDSGFDSDDYTEEQIYMQGGDDMMLDEELEEGEVMEKGRTALPGTATSVSGKSVSISADGSSISSTQVGQMAKVPSATMSRQGSSGTHIDGLHHPPYSKNPVVRVFQKTARKIGRGIRRMNRSIMHSFSRWNTLKDAPRELWIIYLMKFLSSYSYFSFALCLTIFLTDEFGVGDEEAGWIYGAYGLATTAFGVICGWFIDYMGVKQSLVVGSLLGTAARLFLAISRSKSLVVWTLYTLLPFSECLGVPILTIGIKRYTNLDNRTFAFSFYYSIMNIAALVAGPAVDMVRTFYPHGVMIYGIHFSSLRVILLSSASSTLLMMIVVGMGVREIEVDEQGNVIEYERNKESSWDQTKQVLQSPAFWRLTLFTFLMVGVRLVFRHVDATMPKYLIREFGESAPFGLVYAINPFLIIFFVPILGLIIRDMASFDVILIGSYISALAPFWICIDNAYWTVIMFMVTLSIGEAIYSPRVYEYTMEISGRGQEGIYSSLASAPLFSVKLLVGGMSGWLLAHYCPAEGERKSRTMWAIIGGSSIIAPILMTLLRNVIDPPEEDTDKEEFLALDENGVFEEKKRNKLKGPQVSQLSSSKPISIEDS